MVSRVIPVDPFDLVIFGATGDLARRKILPSLYRRWKGGQIPAESRIIAAARTELSHEDYLQEIVEDLKAAVAPTEVAEAIDPAFLARLVYVRLDAEGDEGWAELAALMRPETIQAFYFSVGPTLFAPIAERLTRHAVANGTARIVVEKPFGNDLASARALNKTLAQHFDETQIYRIDHYLGKETVQNLMAVRFGNILFEPLWNAQYVDHVQITVAETLGVAGRGPYYDRAGAMRDMVQNHLMQLLCLIAMEPPYHFDPTAVRDEKLKVIRALDPVSPQNIVRGQYRGDTSAKSYLADVDQSASMTETFVALKLGISNWRWKGTPFYIRTGKRLKARASEIAVTFKEPPHSIFDDSTGWRENVLVIRLQPDEGMNLKMMIKDPGPGGMRLVQVPLDMSFAEALGEEGTNLPDAYERLIMDVIRGNQTLFMRGDEVEAAWAWTDPLIASWQNTRPFSYAPGSTGPAEALSLMHRDGRRWREIR